MGGWNDYGYDDELRFKARIPILGAYLALNDRKGLKDGYGNWQAQKWTHEEVMERYWLNPFTARSANTILSHMNTLLGLTQQLVNKHEFIDHTRMSVPENHVVFQWNDQRTVIYWNWTTLCEAAGDNPENYLAGKQFNLRGDIRFFLALKKIINLLLYHIGPMNAGSILVQTEGEDSVKSARYVGSVIHYSYTNGNGGQDEIWLDPAPGYLANTEALYQNTAQTNISEAGGLYPYHDPGDYLYRWWTMHGQQHDSYTYCYMSKNTYEREYSYGVYYHGEKLLWANLGLRMFAITEYQQYGQPLVTECVPLTVSIVNGAGVLEFENPYPPEEPSGGSESTLASSSSRTRISATDLNGNLPVGQESTTPYFYFYYLIPEEFL